MPKENKSEKIYIITIAFNNELLLEYQIKLLKKNIIDDYVFVVADNSSKKEKRKIIEQICRVNNIAYISLPQNPYGSGSESHAACLNWMYKNYISKIKPEYFGFIDHDIYPIKNHSIIEYLKNQDIYGHKQTRDKIWYLWGGMCFFNYKNLGNVKYDFMPGIIENISLDTGGLNFKNLYSKIDINTVNFPEHKYIDLRENDPIIQSGKIEIIGDWLHSFNGSYWTEAKPKELELNDFLEKYY